ncbi:MAG TPA: hypothetical protein VGS20_02170 [Candidatus Acidoferrales bacterium]|nr:hypothetical protein [Candidatus Acidoferrales bacterium]
MRFHFLLLSSALALALAAPVASPLRAQTGPTIALTVDATGAPQKIIHTRIEMPAAPGPLTFYYPKWIPGEHEPDGPIANLTGLHFSAAGAAIPWTRDLRDVFTFHVIVPPGASQLAIDFDYIEPGAGIGGYTAASATDKLVDISWNQNLLYPAGVPAQQITYNATLVLPEGWKFGTALPVANQSGNRVTFQPVSLNRLVDSPAIAGEYYRAIDLTPPGEPVHHEINLVADSAHALDMSPAVQKGLTNLVAETGKLFGARHYRDYHFLLTLSDHVAHFGLEHHESNDSRLPERALISPGAANRVGSLLAHEYVHSWNGKFRRPQDLSAAYYEAPMDTDLLWVYEGLTDYLGHVLATRSGLWTEDDYHRYLADIAGELGPGRPGRTWRPLLDTAAAVPGMFRGGWIDWRRGTDYYNEGDLVWLEAATIIHDESHGAKSFDDFCKLFYAGPNNGPELKPYTLDQLVEALNGVTPYDWAKFFRDRLDSTVAAAPLGGVVASGWNVAYDDRPERAGGGFAGGMDASYSIGLTLRSDGTVVNSIWGGPAFHAGVSPGMKVVGVNGRVYTAALLEDAIAASRNDPQPIKLLVVDDDYYVECDVDYHGGARYPHLVREADKPDYLAEILSARAKSD